MCGRYTYYSSSEIVDEFELLPKDKKQLELFKDNFNVTPGSDMPVLIRGKQEHELEFMVWGLIPSWSKDRNIGYKLINARKEGLLEKNTWKRLVNSKRCVVPARGFYEWKKLDDDSKQPFYITPTSGKVFSFAGLWDEWKDETGRIVRSYTIITKEPNKEMSDVHNRMPAILTKEQSDIWLSPLELEQAQLDDILGPTPDGSVEITKVSKDVNSPKNNRENLIYPLED
jgi:putative SOS response-associated peptidase YedK